jgi:hypothetical protein
MSCEIAHRSPAGVGSRRRCAGHTLADHSQRRGAKIGALLIAATAEAAGLVVLHYDRDFDLIAGGVGQPVEWIVPAGSVPWRSQAMANRADQQ